MITAPGILGDNRLCWATFSAGASWIIIWLEVDVLLVFQQLWGRIRILRSLARYE